MSNYEILYLAVGGVKTLWISHIPLNHIYIVYYKLSDTWLVKSRETYADAERAM